jgi:HSP20 family protein
MTKNMNVEVQQGGAGLLAAAGDALENYLLPAADIYETPEAFVVLLDMPGADKETISLSMHKETLVVKAHVPPHHREDAAMLLAEIATPGYFRSFRIGGGVDVDNVDAQYALGVLTVKLYKSEDAKPREIQMK